MDSPARLQTVKNIPNRDLLEFEPQLCAYCRKPFHADNPRQIYCKPQLEKRLVHERKKALVELLTILFLQQPHWRARDMRTVAQRCVFNDAESAWLVPAVQALGWVYREKSKRWIRKSVV